VTYNEMEREIQKEILKLSTCRWQKVVSDSGRNIHTVRPDIVAEHDDEIGRIHY
jgi:hypothetical protein